MLRGGYGPWHCHLHFPPPLSTSIFSICHPCNMYNPWLWATVAKDIRGVETFLLQKIRSTSYVFAFIKPLNPSCAVKHGKKLRLPRSKFQTTEADIPLPEPDTSKFTCATWQCSDSNVNPWLILFNPFSLYITGITDGKLS